MKRTFVVPMRDEEDNVEALWARLAPVLQRLGDSEAVFVDDGSRDGTARRVKALDARGLPLVLVSLARPSGLSAALQAGFDAARGGVVVTLDADLQNDPEDAFSLIAELERGGFGAVCGRRVRRDDPPAKIAQSAAARVARRLLTGDTLNDSGCGLRALRAECARDLRLSSGLHRWIGPLARRLGYTVGEAPVGHRARLKGRTKFGFWDRLFQGTRDLFTVWGAVPASWKLRKPAYRVKETVRL